MPQRGYFLWHISYYDKSGDRFEAARFPSLQMFCGCDEELWIENSKTDRFQLNDKNVTKCALFDIFKETTPLDHPR